MDVRLWLRWMWRDLRQRLAQVGAIAAIIALGSGIFSGLGSTSVWRYQSLDLSFQRLNAHDLQVSSPSGQAMPAGALLAAVRTAGGTALSGSEARLIVDLPVRAGQGGAIPAAGVIVGADQSGPAPIDRWKITAGKNISATDQVLLDAHFVAQHHLPDRGTITIAGTSVAYVGAALQPEYLNLNVVVGDTIQGAATRAVVYGPLSLVQHLAGLPGQADSVVMTLRPGADAAAVGRTISAGLDRLDLPIATEVTARSADPQVRSLYDEVTSEQTIYDLFALLLLAGAGFAAFNLTRRVVEAQRRDIGIAMSLGVPARAIAMRPLALATEVALAGVGLGVAVGWLIGDWVLSIIERSIPLPYWTTPWQWQLSLLAAALALMVPLLGSAYPVWRAVRVAPTYALLPSHLRGGRHRLTSRLRNVRLPGSTLAQAPLRRVTIAPARSAMTALAITLILAPLFAAFATTDSTTTTIEAGSSILAGHGTDRLLVNLTGYEPQDSAPVRAITRSPLVGASSLALQTGGYLQSRGRTIAVSISMVSLSDPLAVPPAVTEQRPSANGIVISSKAASDLALRTGSTVTLRHPTRQGIGYTFTQSTVPVAGVVDSPYSFVAYMDLSQEPLMGLQGIVNAAILTPRAGVGMDQLQRGVSSLPGVASALDARALAGTMRGILSLVTDLFVVLQVVIGLLAFLVAYNSSRVSTDERTREHATMMAFGVRVSRVVGIAVAESLLIGVSGVAAGIGVGMAVSRWVLSTVFPAAIPQLAVVAHVAVSSYLTTAVIGMAAVATAPLLTARKLSVMSLPGTLRYVE